MWSKEASIKKTNVEFKRNETLQVTRGHTMIYYSFLGTLTGSEFSPPLYDLLPALLPLADPPSPYSPPVLSPG